MFEYIIKDDGIEAHVRRHLGREETGDNVVTGQSGTPLHVNIRLDADALDAARFGGLQEPTMGAADIEQSCSSR